MRAAGETQVVTPHATGSRVPSARASRAPLPQEQVVARLRQSGRRLMLPAVLFIAFCGAAGYLWHRLEPAWLDTAVLVALGIAALVCCLAPLLRWLNRVVLVTNRRLIVTRGLARRRQEFLLVPGAETRLRRGPLQLLSGSGDVTVQAGGEGRIVLKDVPSARLVQSAIAELVERLR